LTLFKLVKQFSIAQTPLVEKPANFEKFLRFVHVVYLKAIYSAALNAGSTEPIDGPKSPLAVTPF
jgi:hypothetical protein